MSNQTDGQNSSTASSSRAPATPRGPVTTGPASGEPYCANCGYILTGLTDTPHCPECGKQLVEVLVRARGPAAARGRRYRSEAMLLGWPVVEIALGPREDLGEHTGKAKAWIAIGDVAIGGIAIGGQAYGGVAIGGLAAGGATLGGLSIGAISALGGGAIGGWAVGGGAAGVVASGGGAAGYIASGGGAVGVHARGAGAIGVHAIDGAGRADPQAVAMFQRIDPMVLPGPGAAVNTASLTLPILGPLAIMMALAAIIGLIAGLAGRPPRPPVF